MRMNSNSNDINLLVSTTNGIYRVTESRIKKLKDYDFYGITWSEKEIYLAARYSRGCVMTWDGTILPALSLIRDIHQILWWENKLYATNTAKNRIDVWDGRQTDVIKWTEKDVDTEHINSVWCDGERFYVCEHRRGVEPVRIRIFNQSFELTDTQEFCGLHNTHYCGLHNVYVEDGWLYTLSVDRLVRRYLATGETELINIQQIKDDAVVYLRGLARTDGYFFIGESQAAGRAERRRGDGHILIFDDDLSYVGKILLEDVGQIHEVRAISGDLAHNNLPCPEREELVL